MAKTTTRKVSRFGTTLGRKKHEHPLLPIEFARESKDRRITLVIVPDDPNIACVRSLWALMVLGELERAKKALTDRERIDQKNIERDIGFWSNDASSEHECADDIGNWASRKDLDAVVWTALPPKFKNESNRVATPDEVISFLKELSYVRGKRAEEYIRKAPLQIDTEYRRRIETEFGWSPVTEV